MCLSRAGWPEQVDDLASGHEVQLRQRQHAVAIQRRLEREVVGRKRLDACQTCGHQRHPNATALAHLQLLSQEQIERFQGGDLALLELADDRIESLQCPGHLESHQVLTDALQVGTG